MRILVITNLFPPVVIGGYELGCAQLVAILRARGHDVDVLTSEWRSDQAPPQPWVHRVLPFSRERQSLGDRVVNEFRAQHAARRVVRAVRPDVTYVFNPRWISRSALFAAQAHGPVSYFVSDPWLAHEMLDDGWSGPWQKRLDAEPTLRTLAARALSRLVPPRVLRTRFPELDLMYATFSSDAVRRDAAAAGLPVASAPIIHWGVDIEEFALRPSLHRVDRFLYVGQIMPHKGVKTAIDAFIELCGAHPERPLSLTLLGGTTMPEYEAELRRRVAASPVAERLHFAGFVSKDEVAAVYAEHDALIFPSEWDEPFSLVLMEGMASGLPVVSTLTGGTPEIAVPGQNMLSFPAGDSRVCCAQLEQLFDVELANRLRAVGRATIEAGFTIEVMVDRVEASLLRAARREQPSYGGLRGDESPRESIGL